MNPDKKHLNSLYKAEGSMADGPNMHIGYFYGTYSNVFDYVSIMHEDSLGYGLILDEVKVKHVDTTIVNRLSLLYKEKSVLENKLKDLKDEINKATKQA